MISWQMWRAIHTPFVAHPLYYMRGMVEPQDDGSKLLEQMERNAQRLAVIVIILMTAAVIHFGPAALLFVMLGIPLAITFLGVPFVLLIAGTIYGIIAVTVTALTISRERYQGRLEILGATPYGLAGATWALGSIAVQQNMLLKRMRQAIQPTHYTSIFMIVFVLTFLSIPVISKSGNETVIQTFIDGTGLLALAIFTIIDLAQAGNIGSLTGMIAATSTSNTAFIQGRALAAFMLLHFGSYMIIWGICELALPRLGIAEPPLYYGACLISAYAVRESVTIVLWWLLIHVLDANHEELNTIARIGIQRRQRTIPRP